ncbi:MAG: hypothetical protein QF475_01065 [Candidatus Undinarchaeales archaeon]|jgi:uncharacterized protein (DUF3084 family)|nr:hypothetical protein [Candidatus Undinarchaeales archaeon]
MAPPNQPKASPKQAITDMTWRMNNLETKARINEQNIINDRRHVQILNKNVLDLKKELRTKTDSVMSGRQDVSKTVTELVTRVENIERRMKRLVKREEVLAMKKFHENFNYFDKDMTTEEADHILDDILKKTEG